MRWCIIGLIVVLLGVAWRLDHVSGQLEAEKVARATAENRVESIIVECEGWVESYFKALETIDAHKDNAQACLDREAQTQKDAAERAEIMAQTKPRPKNEKDKVVADETRLRIVNRLNRPL